MDENSTPGPTPCARTAEVTARISSADSGSRGWATPAASRGRGLLAVAAVLFGLGALVAGAAVVGAPRAEPGMPSCPAVVGDLPLSVTVPFSGTVRSVAGEDGTLAERSLRCAYGEGVAPAVDVAVRWRPATAPPCATVTRQVADGVDGAAVDDLAEGLVGAVGAPCAASAATEPSRGLAALAAALVGSAVTVLVLHRRRRRASGDPVAPAAPAVEAPGRRHPELVPLVEVLRGAGGATAARRVSGQLTLAAAQAHLRRQGDAADLARRAGAATAGVRFPAGRRLRGIVDRLGPPEPRAEATDG